jgi:beta-lactamase class D
MRVRFPVFVIIALIFTGCSTNNVTVDDSMKQYFDSAGVRGDFGLLDNGQGHFTIYNLSRFRDSAFIPGATFDIVQSLLAIQTGVARDEHTLMPGSAAIIVDSLHPQWIAPRMTLSQAFRAGADSDNLGFRDLARLLGHDSLKKWVDSLRYGNRDLGGSADSFWLTGPLKINSDEQLGLMKKLYFGQLPFFRRSQEAVRNMMLTESNSNYKIVYKTGSVNPAGGPAIGWVVGWVEENKHPYFFVLNLESDQPRPDLAGIGLQLVKNLLRPMGFFEGKK